MSVAQIQKLGASIGGINSSHFGKITPSALGNGFTGAASITSSQAYNLTNNQLAALSNANLIQNLSINVFSVLSVSQVANFSRVALTNVSAERLNALGIDARVLALNVINGSIGPINIKLLAFNTDISSNKFDVSKIAAQDAIDASATVVVTMAADDIRNLFKYQHSDEGITKLYLDQTKFKVTYNYASTNGVNLMNNTSYTNVLGTKTFSWPTMQWNGPVNSDRSIDGETMPLSWDYTLYTAQSVFTQWQSYTFFNNIYGSETTLRTTINSTINSKINPILSSFDCSAANPNGSAVTKYFDASANKWFTPLEPNASNANIMSYVFDYMYSVQPERFIGDPVEQIDRLYSYPFIVGDTLQFKVIIHPDPAQTQLVAPNAGFGPTVVGPRSYIMQINVVA